MPPFHQATLTLDHYWRAIILYGRNVASYKFALAKTLLEKSHQDKEVITLEELAEPFARHVCEHLQIAPKQATSPTSRFLDACRAFNGGDLSHDELLAVTERLGFVNVIDAFHIVNRDEVGARFFLDERKTSSGGIRLTDELWRLREDYQFQNLPGEIEARWRLVETAWELNVPRAALTVEHDPDTGLLLPERSRYRRPSITSTREALNGYQKGRCFYCFRNVSIQSESEDLADVDHFFPHSLVPHGIAHPINGVWNLVLACQACNRGAAGKFDRLPALRYLERLHTRNEYLIGSHHPLRDTLIEQTGRSTSARHAFLQRAYLDAQAVLVHVWEATHEFEAIF